MPRRLRVTRHWFSGEGGLGVILANPDLSGSRRGFWCLNVKGSDETGGAVETLRSFVYVSPYRARSIYAFHSRSPCRSSADVKRMSRSATTIRRITVLLRRTRRCCVLDRAESWQMGLTRRVAPSKPQSASLHSVVTLASRFCFFASLLLIFHPSVGLQASTLKTLTADDNTIYVYMSAPYVFKALQSKRKHHCAVSLMRPSACEVVKP